MDVVICIGSSGHLRGSKDVIQILQNMVRNYKLEDKVNLQGCFCMGECTEGVCVTVDGKRFHLTPDKAEQLFYDEILGGIEK